MQNKKLRIAIAAGGTAGHINPALALAERFRLAGHTVVFFGHQTRLESTLVPQAGFEFVGLDLQGFNRSRPWTLVSALYKLQKSEQRVARYVKENQLFDLAIGFGAYIEIPLIRYAQKHDIPTLLHEQNSIPGMANKKLALHADVIALSFEQTRQYFSHTNGKVVYTGNPVRTQITNYTKENARQKLGINEACFVVLVFGGSLGAAKLNQSACALADLDLQERNMVVIHATGTADYQDIKHQLQKKQIDPAHYRLFEYIEDMGACLNACDVVVSRAGASTLAEISAVKKPSILVPYPLATENHQFINAQSLVADNQAMLVQDIELNGEVLKDKIDLLMNNPEMLENMQTAFEKSTNVDACENLYDQCCKLVGISNE